MVQLTDDGKDRELVEDLGFRCPCRPGAFLPLSRYQALGFPFSIIPAAAVPIPASSCQAVAWWEKE